MNEAVDYLKINRELWNQRTSEHVDSVFYDNPSFINGRNSLNKIELALLGNVAGKSILHLQCHFGQDTISLSRMGAHATGIDFSDQSIETAIRLARQLQTNTRFICTDIYGLPDVHDEKYDLLFTSYGTIGWLPDLNRWARVVSTFLKPGGRFVMVDFHPVVWMYNNDFTYVQYPYFKSEPILETETGTYANREAKIQTNSVSWNHSLSELFSSLLGEGLKLEHFSEYNYSPYKCFNNMVEIESAKFQIQHMMNKLPMVYALVASKS